MCLAKMARARQALLTAKKEMASAGNEFGGLATIQQHTSANLSRTSALVQPRSGILTWLPGFMRKPRQSCPP
jgi:hypothetical protein